MYLWTSRNYTKNDKIYRGQFHYFRNENQYAEEAFEVFRDKKDNTYHYISECIVRVSTGEILNMHVEYIVNKDYIPTFVYIEKIMGKTKSFETFEYNSKRNILNYKFVDSNGNTNTAEVTTAPKFHITTPTAASSMLFLRSKKFDTNSKNSFNVLVATNQWEYTEAPVFKTIVLDRPSVTSEKINIEGQNVQSTQYRIYDEITDFKNLKDPPHIKTWVSQHGGIPYVVKSDDGTKIQIKYLNDLAEKE